MVRNVTCCWSWTVTVRSAKRAMLARMSSAVLVQTYGWSAVLEASMNSRMADYSLLATVEAIFDQGTLGRNDTSATPMSDLFRGGIP